IAAISSVLKEKIDQLEELAPWKNIQWSL
ncbi:hypothetical protein A2U01_0048128, partial [Trifolium medium]|nr:hypothetical protein [Trifolium medium]